MTFPYTPIKSDSQEKDPNLFLYALWPLGSYSSQVATKAYEVIMHNQWPFYKCRTKTKKAKFIQPEIRLTQTNGSSIELLSWSDIGIVPFTNKLGWVVWGNMKLIKELLEQWSDIRVLGWYFLRIQHILAAKRWTKIEDLESIHSHPQALIQCRDKLLELWCVDTEEISENTNRRPEQGEAMICKAQDWRMYEAAWYKLVTKWFQDLDNPPQRYTLFVSSDTDGSDIRKIMWTYEALEACSENILGFDKIKRVREKSTTCHIEDLWLNEAVICSVEAANAAGLEILDNEFCPKDNFTHFAFLQRWKGSLEIPWISFLEQWRIICTIEIPSTQSEKWIFSLMKDSGINILFEDRETLPMRDLFTGVIEHSLSWNKFAKFRSKVNELWWRIKVL